jgi:hypothetical protein
MKVMNTAMLEEMEPTTGFMKGWALTYVLIWVSLFWRILLAKLKDDWVNEGMKWLVVQEEAMEQEAREELFRESLAKEIEGKVGELRELEQGADKEKELVWNIHYPPSICRAHELIATLQFWLECQICEVLKFWLWVPEIIKCKDLYSIRNDVVLKHYTDSLI